MTKEFGSRLASSVRQAKAKQPQKNTPDTQQASELSKPEAESESESPLPPLPSKRVWPD